MKGLPDSEEAINITGWSQILLPGRKDTHVWSAIQSAKISYDDGVLTQPENWIKGRDIDTGHVASTTNESVHSVVNILQAPIILGILHLLKVTDFSECIIAHRYISVVLLKYPDSTFSQIAFYRNLRKIL